MTQHPHPVLDEIEAFLSETGMGASYFGKRSTGNSEVVKRLREGRPILSTTEAAIRAFIAESRANASHQPSPSSSPQNAGGVS